MSESMIVVATGSALPRQVWSNAALIEAKGLDSSDAWVRERTGIAQRFIVSEGETTFTLARDAVRQALARAGAEAKDVGVLVVATCTPDLTFPSVAALVHGDLGFDGDCAVLDINAACSGFIHALAVAKGLLAASGKDYAVVAGAETFSNLVDWSDRGTCLLFGDGAGAVVLRKERGTRSEGRGVLAISLGADGTAAPMLQSSAGVARGRTAGVVLMNGREVFKRAVRQMGSRAATDALLAEAGVGFDEVDWLVPHQANARIIEAAAREVGLPMDKVVVTVGEHANTSAASIPLALDTAVADGRIQPGNVVLLQAFGAGFAWSGAVVRW